ncbi:thioesterase family protein [Nocardioides lentus]|uniref:Thioesterase family protein n=1 Tax=Nocardioides lentus TaxID=338077 RepID=A0ABP5ACX8_9ACTN
MAYFTATGPDAFTPTEHVGGAWEVSEQHIAPALGLLVRAVEADRDARRDDGLVLGRCSFDILGTVPMAEVTVAVRVLRPGRTIELVEASLAHAGRDVVVLRAWLTRPADTAAWAGGALPPLPGLAETEPFDGTGTWPGGFIRSVEIRRRLLTQGRAQCWVRSHHDLVADRATGPVAATLGLVDVANGLATREPPGTLAYPNLDLTAHLFGPTPAAREWVGFDTTVTFGAGGVGLTSTVLHGADGPFGTVAQVLTLRPVGG